MSAQRRRARWPGRFEVRVRAAGGSSPRATSAWRATCRVCKSSARFAANGMRRLVLDEAHAIGVLGPGRAGLSGGARSDARRTGGNARQGSRMHRGLSWPVRGICADGSGIGRDRSFSQPDSSPILAAIARGAVAEARADDAGRARVKDAGMRLRAALLENRESE